MRNNARDNKGNASRDATINNVCNSLAHAYTRTAPAAPPPHAHRCRIYAHARALHCTTHTTAVHAPRAACRARFACLYHTACLHALPAPPPTWTARFHVRSPGCRSPAARTAACHAHARLPAVPRFCRTRQPLPPFVPHTVVFLPPAVGSTCALYTTTLLPHTRLPSLPRYLLPLYRTAPLPRWNGVLFGGYSSTGIASHPVPRQTW